MQNKARKGEMEAYPCSTAKQQLLDQVSEPSTLENQSQSAGMDGGGGRL